MPRPPRLQFPGAIYHMVTRGDGRRALFHDDAHYERLSQGLADEVHRSGWQVLAFCWMPNHVHLLLRTPEPNLCRGMQHWLSGYANWYAKRNRRSGHLFQGRYKSFLVEDESYFWTLSRYIHLNPCTGTRPLAARPQDWSPSSYGGYARKSLRNDWIEYDLLLDAWRGQCGGSDPSAAYRKHVAEGLGGPTENPLKTALCDWVIGSENFLRRMVAMADGQSGEDAHRWSRRFGGVDVEQIIQVVATVHQVAPEEYVGFRSAAAGREVAALLCRRWTGVSLAKLSRRFGLRHPDSSANLVRRAKKREADSAAYRRRIKQAELLLISKTENQV